MRSRIYKQFLLAMLAILGVVGAEAFAQVGPTATVTVTAQVNAACRFQTTTGSMTISNGGGVINPALGTNATGTTALTYRCTNGTAPLFQIDASGFAASHTGVAVTLNGSSTTLASTFDISGGGSGLGLGSGGDRTATLTGNISAANIDAATPDTYTATVTVGISN